MRDAVPGLKGGQTLGVGVDPGHDLHAGHGGIGLGMGVGHAAGPDDQKADIAHLSPSSPS